MCQQSFCRLKFKYKDWVMNTAIIGHTVRYLHNPGNPRRWRICRYWFLYLMLRRHSNLLLANKCARHFFFCFAFILYFSHHFKIVYSFTLIIRWCFRTRDFGLLLSILLDILNSILEFLHTTIQDNRWLKKKKKNN